MLASMCNHGFLSTPQDARDALFDRELSKTLGRMAQGLEEALPPTLEDRLTRAVEIRNWLAHRYFRERASEILSVRGREVMISELQERADFLQVLDGEFTGLMEKWLSRMGVSSEDIRAEMQRFRDETTGPTGPLMRRRPRGHPPTQNAASQHGGGPSMSVRKESPGPPSLDG